MSADNVSLREKSYSVAVQLSEVCVIFSDDGAASADHALSWAMMSHARHLFIIALLAALRAGRLRNVP